MMFRSVCKTEFSRSQTRKFCFANEKKIAKHFRPQSSHPTFAPGLRHKADGKRKRKAGEYARRKGIDHTLLGDEGGSGFRGGRHRPLAQAARLALRRLSFRDPAGWDGRGGATDRRGWSALCGSQRAEFRDLLCGWIGREGPSGRHPYISAAPVDARIVAPFGRSLSGGDDPWAQRVCGESMPLVQCRAMVA